MSPSILFANTTIAAREKIKFDRTTMRKMFSASTVEEAAKFLLPFGYDIEHEDHIVTKKLGETLDIFAELCPDVNLKKFVLASAKIENVDREKNLKNLRVKLKNFPADSILYIEDYFGKGVTALPVMPKASTFDLEMFLNWFIMKLEELRIVKALLFGKKLGIPREQLQSMIRGGKWKSL